MRYDQLPRKQLQPFLFHHMQQVVKKLVLLSLLYNCIRERRSLCANTALISHHDRKCISMADVLGSSSDTNLMYNPKAVHISSTFSSFCTRDWEDLSLPMHTDCRTADDSSGDVFMMTNFPALIDLKSSSKDLGKLQTRELVQHWQKLNALGHQQMKPSCKLGSKRVVGHVTIMNNKKFQNPPKYRAGWDDKLRIKFAWPQVKYHLVDCELVDQVRSTNP